MRWFEAWAVACGMALAACGGGGGGGSDALDADGDASEVDSAEPDDGTLRFPPGFLFGAAIAGFQADMGCPTLAPEQCEDRGSDWYQWITSPEILADPGAHMAGDPPTAGPGFWELYEQDIERLAGLGLRGFRMSLEWSRIFPTATDGVESMDVLRSIADPEAVARYHAIFAALKARGVTPLVTLNHYTLPLWLHDGVACHEDLESCRDRGWVDSTRAVHEIAKYARFVGEEFGAEVDLWATENEPFAVVFPGYIFPSADRVNPPGVSLASAEAKTVFNALIEAHARMYDALKAADTKDADGDGVAAEVGLVYAMTPFRPADPSEPLDVRAAERAFYLWNLAFLDAVAKGVEDPELDGEGVPRADLAGRMDYVGVNYYTRVTIEGTEDPLLPDLSALTTFNPFTLVVWEDYPRGIYEMATLVRERYGLPVIITENGVEIHEDDEAAASRFFVRHLTWLWRAIRDGVDVRGYFAWTLVDNYEWNHGMELRFGLFAVEPDDPAKARRQRPHATVYGDIATRHGISPALQTQYPEPEAAP
ncbi:MAG: glycoside hydrolase family 1 protein [Deltaproteobacteria bacterium]|nr:glycoside hydrolase family 1 protein [Deltaproteobacteria bacterium]